MPDARPSRDVNVLCDGKVYTIDPSDLDRHEWREVKNALEMTQVEVLAGLAELDLDCVAAILWITRRREESDIAFGDVNLRLSDVFDAPEGEDVDPPG